MNFVAPVLAIITTCFLFFENPVRFINNAIAEYAGLGQCRHNHFGCFRFVAPKLDLLTNALVHANSNFNSVVLLYLASCQYSQFFPKSQLCLPYKRIQYEPQGYNQLSAWDQVKLLEAFCRTSRTNASCNNMIIDVLIEISRMTQPQLQLRQINNIFQNVYLPSQFINYQVIAAVLSLGFPSQSEQLPHGIFNWLSQFQWILILVWSVFLMSLQSIFLFIEDLFGNIISCIWLLVKRSIRMRFYFLTVELMLHKVMRQLRLEIAHILSQMKSNLTQSLQLNQSVFNQKRKVTLFQIKRPQLQPKITKQAGLQAIAAAQLEALSMSVEQASKVAQIKSRQRQKNPIPRNKINNKKSSVDGNGVTINNLSSQDMNVHQAEMNDWPNKLISNWSEFQSDEHDAFEVDSFDTVDCLTEANHPQDKNLFKSFEKSHKFDNQISAIISQHRALHEEVSTKASKAYRSPANGKKPDSSVEMLPVNVASKEEIRTNVVQSQKNSSTTSGHQPLGLNSDSDSIEQYFELKTQLIHANFSPTIIEIIHTLRLNCLDLVQIICPTANSIQLKRVLPFFEPAFQRAKEANVPEENSRVTNRLKNCNRLQRRKALNYFLAQANSQIFASCPNEAS